MFYVAGHRSGADSLEDEDFLGRQKPGSFPVLEDEDYLGRQNPDRGRLARPQEYPFEVFEDAKT